MEFKDSLLYDMLAYFGLDANVIRESGAGFCVGANDDRGFVDIVKLFLNSDDRNDLGKKAKQYYDNNFSREKVMNKLEKILVEEAERI